MSEVFETVTPSHPPLEAGSSEPARAKEGVRYFVLIAAVVIAYGNSFQVPFTFDDLRNIADNPEIRHLQPRSEESGYIHYRRPIGRHTFALNYWWGKLDVRGYHGVNLAIHLSAACILMWLVKDSLSNSRNVPTWRNAAGLLSLSAALLWAIHPLQTQSVTYIVQRFESLASLFLLATLWLLVLGTRARIAWPWYCGSLLAFSLGLATKEIAGLTPLIAVLFDRIFLTSSWTEIVRRRGCYYLGFLPAIGWFVTRFGAPHTGLNYLAQGVSSWDYFRSQPGVIWHYLRLTAWPDQLCLDYNWPIATNWWWIAACGLPLVALLAASCVALFRWPRLGFLGLTFFLTLAPSSSIVPIADLAYEHRMYLPLAPLAIVAMLILYRVAIWIGRTEVQALRGMGVVTCVIAVLLGIRTWQRNNDWANPRKLWTSNVAIAPQSYRAQGNLAMILLEAGEAEPAIRHLKTSLEIKPTAVAYRTLGGIYRSRQEPEQAAECYLKALQERPSYAPASLDLARIYTESQNWTKGVDQLQHTLAIQPRSPIDIIDQTSVLDELGSCHALAGELPAAVRCFRQAIATERRFAGGHLHLAMAALELGDLPTAAEAARTLLRLKPDSKAAQELLDKIDAKSARK